MTWKNREKTTHLLYFFKAIKREKERCVKCFLYDKERIKFQDFQQSTL